MALSSEYKVRPSPEKEIRDVFKILLSPASLLLLGMKPGGVCTVRTSHGPIGPAIVWNATEKIKDDVVQISKGLQNMYGLKLDNKISVSPNNIPVADALNVILHETSQNLSEKSLPDLEENDYLGWSWLLNFALRKTHIIAPGLLIDVAEPEKRTFQIQQINSSEERLLYRAHMNIKVQFTDVSGLDDTNHTLFVSSEGLGGLKTQMQQINDEVNMYNRSLNNKSQLPAIYQLHKGGLILHGAAGTGKSLVTQKVSEAGWRAVYRIDGNTLNQGNSDHRANMVRTFTKALRAQPSLIIIDSLDSDEVVKEKLGPVTNVDKLLCQQLDRLSGHRTLVIGTATKLSNVSQHLRRAKRFATEIEIPVPNSESRAEILKVIGGLSKDRGLPTLDRIAACTHGFVAADLELLFTMAVKLHTIRRGGSSSAEELHVHDKVDLEKVVMDMSVDFDHALSHVHPSAMHNIYIEPPNIRWSEIGGQREVKKILEKAVVWPFKHPEILRKHGAKPKKGLLLYGPPGCSKTMTAKAIATESGLNFLAVKGAELTSMYVGESERRLREIFNKARAVRPSIIFFDEVDAIGASGDNNQHGGIQTVTTLLNELDGFQAMEGVFVLAATNRPEILDPALIRAGRLDTCLYIGLPDVDARRDILRLQMLDMRIGHDVDKKTLSEATEGFSGAEIAQICEEARDATISEEIELRQEQWVSQRHFNCALAKAEKSVTADMLRRYEVWGASRR